MTIKIAAIAGAALLTAAAYGQRGFGRGAPMLSPVARALDTDGDGAVSAEELVRTLMAFDRNGDGQLAKEEVPERMQGMFDRADADRNGTLSAEEIRKPAQAAAGRVGGRGEPSQLDPVLSALDADSTGEISAAELSAAPSALKKLDRNGDGQLTADEVGMNFERGRGGFRGR